MTRVPFRWALCALAGRALCSTAASKPPAPRTMRPRRSRVGSAVAASSEPVLMASVFLPVIEFPLLWRRLALSPSFRAMASGLGRLASQAERICAVGQPADERVDRTGRHVSARRSALDGRALGARLVGIHLPEGSHGLLMESALIGAGLDLGPALVVEMSIAVLAAHQHGRDPRAAGAVRRGRDVAQTQSNTPVGRPVGPRIVDEMGVMQRELAGFHRHVGGLGAVDVDRQRLPTRQEIVGILHLGMTQLPELVRARHHLHAARLDRRIGERHPGRDVACRLEREVGRVLVPAHIGAGARVLGPDAEMEQAEVGADQILDRIEDLGRMHDLVDPGKQKMWLEVVTAAHLPAFGALEVFETVAPVPRLRRRESLDRTDIAVALVSRDLFGCQLLAHQCAVQPPSTNSSVPVTKEESSQARKSAARATSSGWPIRPIGWRLLQKAFAASGSGWRSSERAGIGVSMTPGISALTRMPWRA